MTSRRYLKKKINSIVNDIVEECYNYQFQYPQQKDTESNKIIDDAVDMLDDMVGRVNQAKSIKDRGLLKQYFESINDDLEKQSLKLMERMNGLG